MKTMDYFRGTGRTKGEIEAFEAYFRPRGCLVCRWQARWTIRRSSNSTSAASLPALAGPKRPQDRIELGKVSTQFVDLFSQPNAQNGFNRPAELLNTRVHIHRGCGAGRGRARRQAHTCRGARSVAEMESNKPTLATAHADAPTALPTRGADPTVGNGDVLIAAITSCTNTSNPSVLLAAGLLAKKAVEAGLKVQPHIKTSLAPGSRIVTEYLTKTGPLPYLEKLGFALAGYGCTTCIGNRGSSRLNSMRRLRATILVCAAVLGQPQLRGAHPPQHQGQLPGQSAAGGGLCHRRHRART